MTAQWAPGKREPRSLGLGCQLSCSHLASVRGFGGGGCGCGGGSRALRLSEAEGPAGLTRTDTMFRAAAPGQLRRAVSPDREGRAGDRVRRRSRAPTILVDRRCGAGESGQSSEASALELFRVALPQPGLPGPWLSRGTLGLLGPQRGQMLRRSLSAKSSNPGPPVAAPNAHRPGPGGSVACLVGQG